jgi:hypothetical protein
VSHLDLTCGLRRAATVDESELVLTACLASASSSSEISTAATAMTRSKFFPLPMDSEQALTQQNTVQRLRLQLDGHALCWIPGRWGKGGFLDLGSLRVRVNMGGYPSVRSLLE